MSDSEKEILESMGEETALPTEEMPISEPVAESPERIVEEIPVAEEKMTLFTHGDKTYLVPTAAVTSLKAKDGKELQVTLDDMSKDQWAKSDIGKKYSELDKEKRQVEKFKKLHDKWLADPTEDGYSHIMGILSDLAQSNPKFVNVVQQFEAQYQEDLWDYVNSSATDRETRLRLKEAERIKKRYENDKRASQQQLIGYVDSEAQKMISEFGQFGVTQDVLQKTAQELGRNGDIDGFDDMETAKASLETIKKHIEQQIKPTKEAVMADLDRALTLVERISPKLAQSDQVVMDALYLLKEKGLPEDQVIKRLRVLHEDTLDDDKPAPEIPKRKVKSQIDKQNRDIHDPEKAFKEGRY